METCLICNKTFKSIKGLARHILRTHNKNSQEYYDEYLKKENDGICKTCNKHTNFKSLTDGYYKFCSPLCAQRNSETKDKIEKTNLKRYGVKTTFQAKEVKEKIAKTNLEKYGAENVFASSIIKDKIAKTNLKRYGTSNVFASNEIKNKISTTCLERYGVTNPVKSKEIQEKIKKSAYKSGVHFNSLKETQDKRKTTCIKKYGVDCFAKSKEFHEKKLSRYFYDNIIFDSSYELCFYKYCKDLNIDISRNYNSFEYECNNKKYNYFPDFIVNNEYVEIKGSYFFENDKMINPYDRAQDSIYEAKHKCMIQNNVKIITDCSKYLNYVGNDFIDKCSLDRKITKNTLIWPKLTSGKQTVINIVKCAQFNEIYKRELDYWNNCTRKDRKNLYENRLKYIHKNPNELSDLEILRGLHISGKIRSYSHFDNTGMKELIKKYNIKSIYDSCAGWGERLITCAALDIEYFGVDINKNTVDNLNKIINHYNLNQKAICQDSANYKPNKTYDIAFTCPPYWNEEIYSNKGSENLQYNEFLDWWKQVVINANTDLFAYQINQKYKLDMNNVLLDLGYELIDEIILKQKSSHFTRKKGKNLKHEYESIQVFKRIQSLN